MNRLDIKNFEDKVVELVHSALFDYANAFKKEEVAFKVNNIKILNNKIENYESELAINFYNNSEGLCDVLEFFLFENGRPAASFREIEVWLRENLDDVLDRQKNNKQ